MRRKHPAKSLQHIVIGELARALLDDDLRRIEEQSVHRSGEGSISPDPFITRILAPSLMQLDRDTVPDVVADLFLVDQNLMDCAARPGASDIIEDAALIQVTRDGVLVAAVLHEAAIDPADGLHLVYGTQRQHNAVGLNALVLTPAQFALRHPAAVDQGTP